MDPPACVQNAMMTKDKKPFTYTPGGIDLSEVRSPRMQRRIERNANLGGVSEVPKPPPPQNYGPLPPGAMAAMRPQTQVQVFPGPPPAPMQKNIPPPPPPPTCPLPTQKVQTGGSEVLERPDMTKIIPENPMSLLRKTGGPAPRKSPIEQMYEAQPPSPPQRSFEAQSPRYQPERPQQAATPISPPYQPPASAQPQYQPQTLPQYQAPQTQPQYQAPPPQPQYQAPPPQAQYQQRSPESPKPSPYHPPIIERQATLPRQEPPQRNNVVSSNVGTLYIPPLNQQQQKMASPPTPPERMQPQVQSPGTPTLKEAPRPWQQRSVPQQQQELPAWAKKDEPPAPNMQQRWQPAAPAPQQPFSAPARSPQQPSNSYPVEIEIRTIPYQPQAPEGPGKPNAVFVTQPVVLQHPGPKIEPPYQGSQQQQYQQQQTRQQVQQQQTRVVETGTRIIPIKIEGRTPPTTPGDRSLNRQLSWGSQPSQSNSFKVIQKFTRTDDEEDDDTPVTQHSARFNQEMPEQVRRMKINDNNNGHFRQEFCEEIEEENPRYRGGYVRSSIFTYLDKIGPQQNNGGRSVPVEPPYVHPSEQVVPEPKKYMGSNIPSRSFKILQAMTAPSESCANANYNEELPYNNNNPVFNPYAYPYYPPPYWPDYYTNFYQSEQSDKNSEKASTKSGRSTPLPMAYPPQPYWHDFYPNNYPQEQSDSTSKMSDRSSKSSKSGRSTPLPPPMPFWGYMPPPRPKSENTLRPQTPNNDEPAAYHYPPMYPPYYDPYYYSYYYGYPPMMPPYPYYHPTAENEELSGYSSMDEMANYNNSRRSSLKRRNSFDNGNNNNNNNSVQALRQHFEVRSKSATPRITITPTYSQENINVTQADKPGKDTEDSDTEVEESQPNGLRSIKSVQNINVFCEDSDTESEDESSEEAETENVDDDIPDQLSVIYEESERGESRRSFRCNSVASEATTIAEHQSEEEDDDFLANQNVKYKINLFQETSEAFSMKSVTGRNNVKVFKEENESFMSFTSNDGQKKLFGEAENRRVLKEESESFKGFDKENAFVVSENRRFFRGAISESSKRSDVGESENRFTDYCNSNSKVISVKKEESESFASFSFNYSSSNDDRKNFSNDVDSRVTVEEVESEVEEIENEVEDIERVVVDEEEKLCIKESCDKKEETDGNWWEVMAKDKEENVKIEANDTNKSKSDYVMVKMDEEVVCVKLRNKNKKLEEEEDLFLKPISTRNSVYDELNEDHEENQAVSGGTLMRVDSFASQLEAIKRNSGLWNLGDSLSNKPENIIQEEAADDTDDSESEHDEEAVDSEPAQQGSTNGKNIESESAEQSSLCTETHEEIANLSEESEIDFWSQIKNDDDDFQPKRRSYYLNEEENEEPLINEDPNNTSEEIIDSANSRHSSCSKSHEKEASDTESSSEDEAEPQQPETTHSRSKSLEPQTIKERIEALKNSISNKQTRKSTPDKEDHQNIPSIKSRISSIEVPTSKTTSTKSSMKSFDEYSEEEELDSGVISDISRHISDNEEFPELKKMTRYERAATHSRLFKLLQDECEIEEEEAETLSTDDKFSKLSVRQSRSKLSLNLNTNNVNEKLVEELVQSLLKSKKAHIFKNMPKEKLYAAAVTILQEGIDTNETPSDFGSFLSPLRGDTETSTPAQTPQEFYNDNGYKQYYDSWSDAAVDIMPSKAFKLLQDHLGTNKLGNIDGFLAKCPRILKLLDENNSDCSLSLNIPQSNDVTNT